MTKILEIKDCKHINISLLDSGYYFPEQRRDIGLKCHDCNTVWDTHFKKGSTIATIKLRNKRRNEE